MKRFYTAESVTEGHQDKLCDLIYTVDQRSYDINNALIMGYGITN